MAVCPGGWWGVGASGNHPVPAACPASPANPDLSCFLVFHAVVSAVRLMALRTGDGGWGARWLAHRTWHCALAVGWDPFHRRSLPQIGVFRRKTTLALLRSATLGTLCQGLSWCQRPTRRKGHPRSARPLPGALPQAPGGCSAGYRSPCLIAPAGHPTMVGVFH